MFIPECVLFFNGEQSYLFRFHMKLYFVKYQALLSWQITLS
uniref:Uncharacterized protein n=1 Tax=Anguilla anguilla TaxID=7936 RepID=A0A0E9V8T2_ANGAN